MIVDKASAHERGLCYVGRMEGRDGLEAAHRHLLPAKQAGVARDVALTNLPVGADIAINRSLEGWDRGGSLEYTDGEDDQRPESLEGSLHRWGQVCSVRMSAHWASPSSNKTIGAPQYGSITSRHSTRLLERKIAWSVDAAAEERVERFSHDESKSSQHRHAAVLDLNLLPVHVAVINLRKLNAE